MKELSWQALLRKKDANIRRQSSLIFTQMAFIIETFPSSVWLQTLCLLLIHCCFGSCCRPHPWFMSHLVGKIVMQREARTHLAFSAESSCSPSRSARATVLCHCGPDGRRAQSDVCSFTFPSFLLFYGIQNSFGFSLFSQVTLRSSNFLTSGLCFYEVFRNNFVLRSSVCQHYH